MNSQTKKSRPGSTNRNDGRQTETNGLQPFWQGQGRYMFARKTKMSSLIHINSQSHFLQCHKPVIESTQSTKHSHTYEFHILDLHWKQVAVNDILGCSIFPMVHPKVPLTHFIPLVPAAQRRNTFMLLGLAVDADLGLALTLELE